MTKQTAEQFLSPESMLTPGFAGALTMMITNALAVQFELPRAHTGLALSFVFGLLILVATHRWWVRGVYYLLNSLIIFCVAIGANVVGGEAHNRRASLVGAAYAQSSPLTPGLQEKKLDDLAAALEIKTYDQLTAEYQSVVADIERQRQAGVPEEKLAELKQRRDLIDKRRTATVESLVKTTTGISIEDIRKHGPLGGPNSEVRKIDKFFAPWKF